MGKVNEQQKVQRVGLKKLNNEGSLMEIIEYHNAKKVIIRFEDTGYTKEIHWNEFIKGKVKNPYFKRVFGKGYLGVGKYKTRINGKKTKQYSVWFNMLKRVYDLENYIKQPTYKDCVVCEEWLNFQNFAKWYDENYYEINNEVMCLDKDILIKGNKTYSPDTCVLVPKSINSLFVNNDADRGKLAIGVTICKGKYMAQCSYGNTKSIYLGLFNTEREAFNSYKIYKEKVIKSVANKYKGKIPNALYNAMIKYEVEITD